MKAMATLHMGKSLQPVERDVLSKYMHNMTDIMLRDTTVFNRARLHTQKTKYQTEDITVADDKIEEGNRLNNPSGNKAEGSLRVQKAASSRAKRMAITARKRFRLLSPALKKEKMKAGVDEEVLNFHEDYSNRFNAALEYYGVESLRDLPEDKKAEFFAVIEEAASKETEEEAAKEDKEHDKKGKKKGNVEIVDGEEDQEDYENEKKGKEQAEEVEHIDELSKKTLGSYVKKAVGAYGASRNLTGKRGDSKPLDRYHQKAAWKRQDGIDKAVDKLTKEEMTPEFKAKRLKMIAKAADRVQSGQASKDAKKAAKADSQNEEMTPEFKAKRLKMIAKAADRVQSGQASKDAKKAAKADSQNEELTVAELRKIIREDVSNKVEAFKQLSQLLNKNDQSGEE